MQPVKGIESSSPCAALMKSGTSHRSWQVGSFAESVAVRDPSHDHFEMGRLDVGQSAWRMDSRAGPRVGTRVARKAVAAFQKIMDLNTNSAFPKNLFRFPPAATLSF